LLQLQPDWKALERRNVAEQPNRPSTSGKPESRSCSRHERDLPATVFVGINSSHFEIASQAASVAFFARVEDPRLGLRGKIDALGVERRRNQWKNCC
jgi:hypothetical protein